MTGGDAGRRVSDVDGGGGKEGGEGVGRKAAAGEAQMDYKTFLDLVLAMDHKQTRQVMSDEEIQRQFGEFDCFWMDETTHFFVSYSSMHSLSSLVKGERAQCARFCRHLGSRRVTFLQN